MANLIVALFEILSFGAIVILVVLGLGVIASMMGIFNFAQGEFVLLGAYVTYLAYSLGLPVWLGMVAAPFVVGALGFVLERLIVRRFYAAPIVIITALVMVGSYFLLAHTTFGLRIRASLENPSLARASGISTSAIYGATFAFGAALAGLAGALSVPDFSLFADFV